MSFFGKKMSSVPYTLRLLFLKLREKNIDFVIIFSKANFIVDPADILEDYPSLFGRDSQVNYRWRTVSECLKNCLDFPGCHSFSYTRESQGFCRLYIGSQISKTGKAPSAKFWEMALGFVPSQNELQASI